MVPRYDSAGKMLTVAISYKCLQLKKAKFHNASIRLTVLKYNHTHKKIKVGLVSIKLVLS